VYKGTNHAFFNDTGNVYDKRRQSNAWAMTVGFLETHLRAPRGIGLPVFVAHRRGFLRTLPKGFSAFATSIGFAGPAGRPGGTGRGGRHPVDGASHGSRSLRNISPDAP